MIEKQVIVTWYTPEEKLPPECVICAVTFSGKDGHSDYQHALGIASWMSDGHGWLVDGLSDDAQFKIEAWCDLEPLGGGKA